ncbi:MAG: ABC transporter permease [Anaerolineae bacterium]|nr:ABC transporter permease [Anaerolineae bacterium]
MKFTFKLMRVLGQTTRVQLIRLSKTWAARLTDLLMPSAIAFVPIILGKAIAGDEAGFNFAQYAHTANYAGFLLIGGGAFILVIRSFWGFGHWLRQEMQGGTLESLYLTPASMAVILAGVALALMLYSALLFVGAMVIGALLFQIVFHTNRLFVALLFLLVGLPPLYGLTLFYGALVLRLKETDAFIMIAQWVLTTLMGVYFPITIFPPLVRIISLLFPPTWLTQGLRGALLDTPYFSQQWWLDLSVLALFCLVAPLLGYLIFVKTERTLRTGSGLGSF